jgi:hypothetical protein
MSAWTPLVPAAMVGTDRQPLPVPAWPGPIGEAAAEAARTAGDPATAALRAAAVLAVCSLAGAQGRAWTEPVPAPAAADTRPAPDDATLLHAIRWAFADGPARLHHEVLAALARAGLRLPPPLLPIALELGRRSIALRSALTPVLGERGLWLAAQRDDWRYAAGVGTGASDEARWHEGSFEQRRAFLADERRRDPAAARARFAEALAELPARERAELLSALAVSLSADDEPLLETLRSDRSKEVRLAALGLLLRLPQAAHPQRAIARLAPLVGRERAGLRTRWRIEAPDAFPDAWKADQVDPARPAHESLGERAWWLHQLVRQVPLAWWTARTGLDPAALVAWAADTDWAEALVRGWRDVLLAAPDEAWADAFLDRWPETLRDDPATILALLPPARRERHWLRQLEAGSPPLPALVARILAACPPGDSLSVPLSEALVAALHDLAAKNSLGDDYTIRGHLPDLAAALHPTALDRLAALPRHADERPSAAGALQAALQVAATRRLLTTIASIPRTP